MPEPVVIIGPAAGPAGPIPGDSESAASARKPVPTPLPPARKRPLRLPLPDGSREAFSRS